MMEYVPRRMTHVLKDGYWQSIPNLGHVKKGDLFRMYELAGEAFVDECGNSIFYAEKDSFLGCNGRFTVACHAI